MLQDSATPVESSEPEQTYTEEEIRSQEALVQDLGDRFASEKRKLNRMLGLDENAGLGAKRASLRATLGPIVLDTLKASAFPLNTTQLRLILGARAPEMKRMSDMIGEMMEDKEVLRLSGGLYVHPENYNEGRHGPIMGKYAARGSKKKTDGVADASADAATDASVDAAEEATQEEEEAPPPPPPTADVKPSKDKSKDKKRK